MLWHRFSVVTLCLLLITTAAATGYQLLSAFAPARQGEPRPVPARQEPRPPDRTNGRAASNQNESRPTAGRMIVSGRVVNARGAPVADAAVMAYAQLKQAGKPREFASWSSTVNGQARSDASGQFQIDAAHTSSARHDLAGVVAFAPGHGVGVFEFDPDAQPTAIEIKLEPEQPIRGRFFDLQGRPVAGVAIKLDGIVLDPREMPHANPLRFRTTAESEIPAWPKPATSDADGRFTLHGLGRGLWVKLVVDDPRFASQMLTLGTEGAVGPPRSAPPSAMIRLLGNPDATPLTIALQPARTLTGRVTYADTGKPALNALIQATGYSSATKTDAEGRFRAKLATGDDLVVTAYPPEGEPYLPRFKPFNWPKGAIEHSLDLVLPRGVMIRGRVTEASSGEPIAGAVLRFQPYETLSQSPNASAPAATNDDGSFQLAIEPAPGYLGIQGPSDDFVLQEIGDRMVREGKPGGDRYYAHAFFFLDEKSSRVPRDINITLRRGSTVKVRVIGPDGRPVPGALIFSRVILASRFGAWKIWNAHPRQRSLRPLRVARAGRRHRSAGLFSRSRAQGGCDGQPLWQVGRRWRGDGAARAVRLGPGAVHRLTGPAREGPVSARNAQHGGYSRALLPGGRARDRVAVCRRGTSRGHRQPQLRQAAYPRARWLDDIPGLDTGCDLSPRRPHGVRWPERPPTPQGIHRQGRRDHRPGRHPDREAP